MCNEPLVFAGKRIATRDPENLKLFTNTADLSIILDCGSSLCSSLMTPKANFNQCANNEN
jgi:hypothetical protein